MNGFVIIFPFAFTQGVWRNHAITPHFLKERYLIPAKKTGREVEKVGGRGKDILSGLLTKVTKMTHYTHFISA